MAPFALRVPIQVGVVALVACLLAAPSLQAVYSGLTCQTGIENNHKAKKEVLLEGAPSGSVFRIPPEKAPVTTTTTPKPGEKPHCVIPYTGNPDLYDWLQVLEETGGAPGKVNATRRTPEQHYTFDSPCDRPLYPQGDEDLIYEYKQSDLKSVFRKEEGYLRFAGTKSEFVDIRGLVVWTPPKAIHDPRIYVADYVVDDTGFWLKVRNSNCTFYPAPALVCKPLSICKCFEDELRCKDNRVVSPNLLASLVG